MNEEPTKRYQVNILDFETSQLTMLDTDKYMVFHEDDTNLVIRTAGCHTQDSVVAMMTLKELLHEALKKEISALRTFETDEQFNTLFEGVFSEMIRELIGGESVELREGNTQGQVEEDDPKQNRFE